MKKAATSTQLQVGQRFEHYEVGDVRDAGEWEVVRVTGSSAVARKLGTRHRTIVAHNEWTADPRTGRRYKRPLLEPVVRDVDMPETRTITISPHASVRRLA